MIRAKRPLKDKFKVCLFACMCMCESGWGFLELHIVAGMDL